MITKINNKFEKALYHKETVVGEFSGRDSVAAILKAFQDGIDYILPIATFCGAEYGDFNTIYDNYLKLISRVEELYGDTKTLYPLLEYNQESLWRLMNGRFITELVKKYGFYNPCIGCHLYFHLTKIPFAIHLSGKIISGERESHDGRVKVNQLSSSLAAYKNVISALGCELIMPLQTISDGQEIEDLIGWNWQEGQDHPKCILSGNYRDFSGKADYNKKSHEDYLKNYIEILGPYFARFLLNELSEKELLDQVRKKL